MVRQAANVAVWAVLASTQWVARWHSDVPLYAAAVHMTFVGFMGGACYSNCMYLFNRHACASSVGMWHGHETWAARLDVCACSRSAHIADQYRELGINMGFFFSNVGIVCATGLVVVLTATVLSKDALFPPDGVCPAKLPR